MHNLSAPVRFCAAALLLCLMGAVAYQNGIQNGWVWDDNQQIAMNPDLRPGAPLGRAFAGDVWSFQHPGVRARSNYFRPMQTLTYRLTAKLFGFNPHAFHAVSLGFHLLATVLAFALFRKMSGQMVGAFVAAALFTVHPMHSEAVDWISALPDIGCTVFFVLAFLLFPETWKSRGPAPRNAGMRRWRQASWALSCFAFCVALLWKETAIVFPLLIVATALCLEQTAGLRNRLVAAAKLSLPYWVVLAGYFFLRIRVLGFLATQQRNWILNPVQFALSALNLLLKCWWKLLVPFPLNAYYVFAPVGELGDLRAVAGILFLLAAAAGIWFAARRAPPLAFSALWVFITLLPVLNLYGVGRNVFTERYLYLPSVGFCLLMVLLAGRGAAWIPGPVRTPVVALSLVSVLALFVCLTAARNPDWKDDATLFARTLEASPQAPFVRHMVASLEISGRSRAGAAEGNYLQAIALAEKESPPDYLQMALSYEGLSSLYAGRGEFDRAAEALAQVRRIDPNDPEVDSEEGLILAQAGRWEQAEGALRKAAARTPDDPNVLNALGLIAWQHYNRLDEAAGFFSRAIALHTVPDEFSASLHNNLGAVYGSQGRTSDAIRELRMAVSLAPADPEFRTHLAIALAIVGRVDEARSELLATLVLAPDYQPAREALHQLPHP